MVCRPIFRYSVGKSDRSHLFARHDLLTLFDLLQQKKIKPLIAQRLPLCQARHAHELLGSAGVIGKVVLIPNG
jgi:NADPH:quinone reductase-like Zn-dependent oxidoreductase